MKTNFTPGPWRWELNNKGKSLRLCGHGECGPYDFTVMDFERWGMAGAVPRFREGEMDTMVKAFEFGEVVKGREHHKHWFQSINHPDAKLIAAAPKLYEALTEIREFIDDIIPNCMAGEDHLALIKAKADTALNEATDQL